MDKLATPFYGEYTYASNLYFDSAPDPFSPALYSITYNTTATVGVFIYYSDGSSDPACPGGSDDPNGYHIDSGASTISVTRNYCSANGTGNQIGTASVSAVQDNLVVDSDGDRGDVGTYYDAQITVTPGIYLGIQGINGTTQDAVIGQRFVLTGLPSGGSWSIAAGTAVGVPGTSGGGTPPGSPANPITLYWVIGGTSSIRYDVSGQSATASFGVLGPTVSVTPTNGTDIWSATSGGNVGAGCGHGVTPDVCIILAPNITPPTNVTGSYEWVQVITALPTSYTNTDGSTHSCAPASSLPALDNGSPYLNVTNTPLYDSPSWAFPTTDLQSISHSYSFTSTLLWQPNSQGAIYVPVATWTWGWGSSLSLNNGSWVLGTPTSPNAQGQNGSTWPQWSSTATNGSMTISCN